MSTDYGESHYIGPIKGAQPNSQAWVDGFPHDAWLDLNEYFARAFKDGVYPPIDRDRIFMWARPHLRDAEATDDAVPRPDRWQLVSACGRIGEGVSLAPANLEADARGFALVVGRRMTGSGSSSSRRVPRRSVCRRVRRTPKHEHG